MMFLRMLLLTQVWESCNLTRDIALVFASCHFWTSLVVYTALFEGPDQLCTYGHFHFSYIA